MKKGSYHKACGTAFLESLKKVPLFSGVDRRHLELIKAGCGEVSAPEGGVIIHQDEQSLDLYFILSGRVGVSLINSDGREVTLDFLSEGDFFGELSFLDNKPRSATVMALSNVKMLVLTKDAFFRILKDNPEISVALLSVLAKRLRKANETIETLTFLDVSGRVAKLLMDRAVAGGEKLPDGHLRIVCPTHQSIANQIGASREAVTKAIKALSGKGLISTKGKEVIIASKQFELL